MMPRERNGNRKIPVMMALNSRDASFSSSWSQSFVSAEISWKETTKLS